MSNKAQDLEKKVQDQIDEIDLATLSAEVQRINYLHDKIVPIVNEVVMAASGKQSYEDAYKAVIDALRLVHQKIAQEKLEIENKLMTTTGTKQALEAILPSLTDIANDERNLKEKMQTEKVEDIANRIQAGELDPDKPRKIGTRPESLKNIRTAKATLFGNSVQDKKAQEDEE